MPMIYGDVVMEEKSLQLLFASPTIVQIKAFPKELLDKTMLLPKEEKEQKKTRVTKAYANS